MSFLFGAVSSTRDHQGQLLRLLAIAPVAISRSPTPYRAATVPELSPSLLPAIC